VTLFEPNPRRQQSTRQLRRSLLWTVALLVVLALLLAVNWASRGPASTLVQLAPYTMSEDVTRMADRMGLSEEGRILFEDSRPQLMDSAAFLQVCDFDDYDGSGKEAAGCYYYGTAARFGQIGIFQQPDDRYANRWVVTAAHELLHAAYDRLPIAEREPLDALLEARWALVPADDPIQASLVWSVGPHSESRPTEQFAYIGSEIFEGIDPALESYFARYFADRSAINAAQAADRDVWAGLLLELETAGAAVVAQQQSANNGRSTLDFDRSQLDVDRLIYNQQVEQYNAQTPHQRAQWFAVLPDGSQQPLETHLAETLASINSREAELLARQPQVDAADAAAQAARTALEQRHADYNTLAALNSPTPS
jgi:hypothetical protein